MEKLSFHRKYRKNFSIHHHALLHFYPWSPKDCYNDPRQFMTRDLDYKPLLYCGFCNQYAMYHEHDCNYNPPWDPYDGCPSEAYDTD